MRKSIKAYGKPLRTKSKARILRSDGGHSNHKTRPIEGVLNSLARRIPQSEWDKLPADLTDNLDHYLYRTPRQAFDFIMKK